MTLAFARGAERDLRKLSRDVASRIVAKLRWFAANFDEQIPQPLGGDWTGFYKLRVGDWRVIYELDHDADKLIARVVDHRSKIYRER